ncbi:hypothetical protein [Paraburkholderia sp. J11-2]|uniref:hypothetical protein n=1 Tax=Paraburkholderia sp. J11-2 TaxID=2805431 RepID=UPI002AB5FDE1|nr:hypothetical protein [Paraburkholderia sp. J11-2]
MPMTSFRRIAIDCSCATGSVPLWSAQLNLGHPFQAKSDAPIINNHSIRLLLQAAQPDTANIADVLHSSKISWHEPMLLSAAASAHRVVANGDVAPVLKILSASFESVQPVASTPAPKTVEYAELRVAPATNWPDGAFRRNSQTFQFEIDAPGMRAVAGVIRVAYAQSRSDIQPGPNLSEVLNIDWTPRAGQRVMIFGCIEIPTVDARLAASVDGVVFPAVEFDLVPTGVEFDAFVPDPFWSPTAAGAAPALSQPALLELRLRLVAADDTGAAALRLDLVGGTDVGKLTDALARLSRKLSACGAVSMQIDTRGVPPVSWKLALDHTTRGYTCCNAGTIPGMLLRSGSIAVKLLTRMEPAEGELGVAALISPIAMLPQRQPAAPFRLTIEAASTLSTVPLANGPDIMLQWNANNAAAPSSGNPDTTDISPFTGFADAAPLAARLTEAWRRSGIIDPTEDAPYVFFALERGWIQMPVPPAPAPDKSAQRHDAGLDTNVRSALAGLVCFDVALASNTPSAANQPGIVVSAAADVSIDIAFAGPYNVNATPAITVTLRNTLGAIDGLLWTGEASPSPVEILPPRVSGPAALGSLPILFGTPGQRGWTIDVTAISPLQPCGLTFVPAPAQDGTGVPPTLAWLSHGSLALVSSVAMTRTAPSAIEPSATRDLFPLQLGATDRITLTLNGSSLPACVPPQKAKVTDDGSARWPWPPRAATGAGTSMSSPQEQAGVAMASLTLPGMEFTLPSDAIRDGRIGMLHSLRFDLPLLDELFANTKVPQARGVPAPDAQPDEMPAPQRQPTALDLPELSDFWLGCAQRLARSRTQADRVVLDESADGKTVNLWHEPDTPFTTGTVRGIAEPYVWKPDSFRFQFSQAGNDVSLGAYQLGSSRAWTSGSAALGGMSQTFRITSDRLELAALAEKFDIEVKGFAASSFTQTDPPANGNAQTFLQDARGLSIDVDPSLSAAKFTQRAIVLRGSPHGQRLSLVTLKQSAPVKIPLDTHNSTTLAFWIRDLPMTGTGPLVFDQSAGLETSADATIDALNPDLLGKALYEWRLFQDSNNTAPGSFEFPLNGPLAARPLRLLACELDANGNLTLLQVQVSVKFAAKVDTKNSPFAAENAYDTGNLVKLTFTRTNGDVKLTKLEGDALTFHARATVTPTSGTHASFAPVSLDLKLKLDNDVVALDSGCVLHVRLFGQNCDFALQNAKFDDATISADCSVDPGDSILALKALSLKWKLDDDPQIILKDARLLIPLSADSPKATTPTVFSHDFDSTFTWLGVTFETPDPAIIDHDAGTVRLAFDKQLAGAPLFRGFDLPPGRVRGALCVVFLRTPSGQPSHWPFETKGTAYVEIAFDAAASDTAQRITAIRHCHSSNAPLDGKADWCSTFRLDASFGTSSQSAIRWPVGAASTTQPEFKAHPQDKSQWSIPLVVDLSHSLDLTHTVTPRLCSHDFPVWQLVKDADGISLGQPWVFRAAVSHKLKPAGMQSWPGTQSKDALEWTSIDQITLIDMTALVRESLAPPGTPDEYAFMARYQSGAAPQSDVPIAGVVRRALALAGFPTEPIMQKLRDAYTGKPDDVPPTLLLAGASAIEALVEPSKAVTFVAQWLLPWMQDEPPATLRLGALSMCRQLDISTPPLKIAAFDAASITPYCVDGSPALSIATRNGAQGPLEQLLTHVLGAPEDQCARAYTAVDQAFVTSESPPTNPLDFPLFARSLLALDAVAKSFGAWLSDKRFRPVMRCLAPSHGLPRAEVRFTVGIWSPGYRPDTVPVPAVTLLVADEKGLYIDDLPPALAGTLVDAASDEFSVTGSQLSDMAIRAYQSSGTPRAALLARVDEAWPGAFPALTSIDPSALTPSHVSWKFVELPTPLLATPAPHVLRTRESAVYASPALGWPTNKRVDDLAVAHARLGEERVLRDEEVAWAGRTRSVAWPANAWTLDAPGAESDNACFIAIGQRTAFRRQVTRGFRAPPDRLATLAPPRARAPTSQSLDRAFADARMPFVATTASPPLAQKSADAERTSLAPILPGHVQLLTIGQRPGAMLTHFEGVTLSWNQNPFDTGEARFGRAAARGPVIARQVRAPRSALLPSGDMDLSLRRQTFVSGDEIVSISNVNGATQTFTRFKLIKGPGVVARYDSSNDYTGVMPRSVTLTVTSPACGWLPPDWDGTLEIVATVPAAGDALAALTCIGLLPCNPDNNPPAQPYATLRIADQQIVYENMTWDVPQAKGAQNQQQKATRVNLTFDVKNAAARNTLAVALRDANADTPVRFTIRCDQPPDKRSPPVQPAALDKPFSVALARDSMPAGQDEDLISGPPTTLSFELASLPPRRRWLPLYPFTLCFADPAYDRELGSPTTSRQIYIGDAACTLAADRADYDLGATLYFAFWRANGQNAKLDGTLDVQVQPADGRAPRRLGITGTRSKTAPYRVVEEHVYAVPLQHLRELLGQSSVPGDTPALLSPGDRLRISVTAANKNLTLDVGIIDSPVLPPPSASYGLAILGDQFAVSTALFATAPLPQVIDFPDLLQDLKAGHVRRRALFLWRFTCLKPPKPNDPFAFLVKIDRTGGGQLPDVRKDFVGFEE